MTGFTVDFIPATMHHVRSVNERMHWSLENQTHQFWRGYSLLMCKHKPSMQRARVVVTFTWPDKRRRDVHNYMAHVVKPMIDGMVEAGVLPDDNDAHLIGPDLRVDPVRGRFMMRMTVEDVSQETGGEQ